VADPLIEIPDKPAFKAAEVCEIAQIPAYVLRSWEKEFPNLGVVGRPGGPRVYRRSDIEQILRIKQLVFSEGLTLSGARRRLEGEPPPEPEAQLPVPEEVKARVGRVKQELKSLLQFLGPGVERAHSAPAAPPAAADPGKRPEPLNRPAMATPGGWPPTISAPPPAPAEPAKKPAEPAPPDDEPALPLMDAEAEASTPPPAAAVPAPGRKRKKGR